MKYAPRLCFITAHKMASACRLCGECKTQLAAPVVCYSFTAMTWVSALYLRRSVLQNKEPCLYVVRSYTVTCNDASRSRFENLHPKYGGKRQYVFFVCHSHEAN